MLKASQCSALALSLCDFLAYHYKNSLGLLVKIPKVRNLIELAQTPQVPVQPIVTP